MTEKTDGSKSSASVLSVGGSVSSTGGAEGVLFFAGRKIDSETVSKIDLLSMTVLFVFLFMFKPSVDYLLYVLTSKVHSYNWLVVSMFYVSVTGLIGVLTWANFRNGVFSSPLQVMHHFTNVFATVLSTDYVYMAFRHEQFSPYDFGREYVFCLLLTLGAWWLLVEFLLVLLGKKKGLVLKNGDND